MSAGLGEILSELARQRPGATAIIDARGGVSRERRLTFAELEKRVAAAAGWLEARGLRHGDAVLVFVPMSAELYIALLAMFRLGVVALFWIRPRDASTSNVAASGGRRRVFWRFPRRICCVCVRRRCGEFR